MAMTPGEQLAYEHAAAVKYANDYINLLQNQITARGLVLNGAIEEFNDFRDLPKTENTVGAAIWDFAFTALSVAVPLLRLGPFIQKMHENAAVALALASQAGLPARGARMVKAGTKAVQKAAEVANQINTLKDAKAKLEESAGKIGGAPAPSGLVAHNARRPIMELIKELDDGTAAWSKATEAELQEYKNRLDDKEPSKPGTLEAYMKGLLPSIPKTFTDSELAEIWTLYLWYMIGTYVADVVVRVKTVTLWRGGGQTTESNWNGLNDNQEDKIVELFGVGVPLGRLATRQDKHFAARQYIHFAAQFYELHATKTETVRKSDPGGVFTKL
jgi:hypothetical protein